MKDDNHKPNFLYPKTVTLLKKAFITEMIAHRHYLDYVQKALQENYPNIAYMFFTFSMSEKIHADNYIRIINELGGAIDSLPMKTEVNTTKENLQTASVKELEKIEKFYPELLEKLETESCESAIVNCMYSWKSHRQHEEKVKEVLRYSGLFFSSLVNHIEEMNLDFHVCEICGSTIDEKPNLPCEICNRSVSHYKKVERPS